jgi:hypothetical protein
LARFPAVTAHLSAKRGSAAGIASHFVEWPMLAAAMVAARRMRIAAVVTQFMKVPLVRPIQAVHCVLAVMSTRRFT